MADVISVYDYYASKLNKFRQENQKLEGAIIGLRIPWQNYRSSIKP